MTPPHNEPLLDRIRHLTACTPPAAVAVALGALLLLASPGCGDGRLGEADLSGPGDDRAGDQGPGRPDTISDGRAPGDSGRDADPAGDAPADGAPPLDGPGDGGPGPDGAPSPTPCWPYDRPATETLRASEKKVFAHYFSPYPLSLDNRAPEQDYYARNYLRPEGENGAFATQGGLLRERPLPQEPWPDGTDFEEKNMEIEVRRAVAIGLDGFTYDVLNPNATSIHRTRLEKLLAAIQVVDPGFKVQLVADMTTSAFGGGGGSDDTALQGLMTLFAAVGNHPSLQRLADGRIVLSAFAAERRDAAFWTSALGQLAGLGHEVAFIPMPVGSWSSNAAGFEGVPLFGASSWGVGTVSGATALRAAPDLAHGQGLLWMAPVRPQDSRPKDLTYIESTNSAAFRAQWDAAIAGGADWVQLITWNDYSEDSEMAPSTRTQTAFYDLSGYFISWFKLGVPPPILRDALYYFHRAHSIDPAVAAPDLQQQQSAFRPVNGPATGLDEIELVALLTAPGTLEIAVGGSTVQQEVEAGIQTLRAPLGEGTPVFRLIRGGSTVLELTSATPIDNQIVYQDPLYHAGAMPTCVP